MARKAPRRSPAGREHRLPPGQLLERSAHAASSGPGGIKGFAGQVPLEGISQLVAAGSPRRRASVPRSSGPDRIAIEARLQLPGITWVHLFPSSGSTPGSWSLKMLVPPSPHRPTEFCKCGAKRCTGLSASCGYAICPWTPCTVEAPGERTAPANLEHIAGDLLARKAPDDAPVDPFPTFHQLSTTRFVHRRTVPPRRW